MTLRRARRAFTLIEMLVVIVIIGILVGLLMPALMKALDKARSAKCAANMSSIYRAYMMRTADESQNWRWIPIRSAGWAGVLLAYVDGKEKVFRCPVDRTGHWGGVNAGIHIITWGSSWPYPGFSQLDSGRNYGWSTLDYHGWGNSVTLSGMTPDSAYLSAVCYVGTPGSASWQVRIASGNTAWPTYTGFSPDYVYGFTILRDTRRLQIDRAYQGTPILDGKGKALYNGTNVDQMVGQQLSVDMVTYCSYGMNDYDIQNPVVWAGGSGGEWMQQTYAFFWPKIPANKVLFMDYTNAQISASRMMTNSVSWGTNVVSFRRHTSVTKSNVMFGDGSVQLLDPTTIDPGVGGNYAQYWQPEQP